MKFRKLASTLAVLLFAGAPLAASANHVDFFEDGLFSILDASGNGSATSTQTGLPTGNTLGGRRDVTLTSTGGGTVNASLLQGDAVVGDNNDVSLLFFPSATGNPRGILTLAYGVGGPLNANFLDIPGSVNDWDRLRVVFGANSTASSLVTVSLFSSTADGTAMQSLAYGGGAGNLDFLYSNFTGDALTQTFLRDIDQASLSITGDARFNFVVQSFNRNGSVAPAQAVSEPATLLLFGAGMASMALARRRRQK